MPVYNGAKYLPHALASIDRQRYDNIEIIVIDDGSTDESAAIARAHPRVRCISQENQGISRSMNTGVQAAAGSIISFLDADDWWADEKLSLQTERLAGSDARIIAGYVQPVRFAGPAARDAVAVSPPYSLLNLGSALFRREVFDEVGVFAPEMHLYGDWDWFLRAREMDVPILVHPEVMLYYLRHDGNVTNEREAIRRGLLSLFRRSLARRRANPGREFPQFGEFLAEVRQSAPFLDMNS